MAARMTPAKVASPVSGYLRNFPAPPLVRNVTAKESNKDLESTLVEVETHKENLLPSSCPLPANTYTTAGVMQEVEIDAMSGPQYTYISDAYGQTVLSEARVTRHLGRRKVDKPRPEEDATSQHESGIRGFVDSIPDMSTLEMSVLETKVVRKFAAPP
jgi:hypothetical protein